MDAAPQLNPDPNPGVARPDPIPFHTQGAEQPNPFHIQGAEQPNPFHMQKAEHPNPFHIQEAEQQNPFRIQEAEQPNPFHIQEAEQQNPFHIQEAEQPNPFHIQEAEQLNPFHIQEAEQPNSLHIQEAEQPNPLHIQEAEQPSPFHIQEAEQQNPFHIQEAEQQNPFHIQEAEQQNPFHIQEAEQQNLIHIQEAIYPNGLHIEGEAHAYPLHIQEAEQPNPFHIQEAEQPNPLHIQEAEQPNPFHIQEAVYPNALHIEGEEQAYPLHIQGAEQPNGLHIVGEAHPDPGSLIFQRIEFLSPPRTHSAIQDQNDMPCLRLRSEHPNVYIRYRDFREEPIIGMENLNRIVLIRCLYGILYADVSPSIPKRVMINAVNIGVSMHLRNHAHLNRSEIILRWDRQLLRQHLYRIHTTKTDKEDVPLDLDKVRLPVAPKKGMEVPLPTRIVGRPSQNYEYRPANDPAYNEDVRRLKEQLAAKRLRNTNRVKRLHPVSRKGLFKEADSKITSTATSASGSMSDERDDSIGVEGWEEEGLPLKEIPWEK